ncbi:MAG: hypothetical protein JO353_13300 [Phycisphaerae bacterium]|nr:hypothetical protein [Phycisphaerae bacterium]
MMRRILFPILLVVLIVRSTPAQTTRPGVELWTDYVHRVAESLASATDDSSLQSLIDPKATLHRFNHTESESIADLRSHVANKSMIACVTSVGVPTNLATDLSAQLRDSATDEIKHLFIPVMPNDQLRADATAAEWITSTLHPTTSDSIGIIVLASSANDRDILIVLMKSDASRNSARLIVFGDPR